jgi:uncharacterized protein YkwD
MTEGSCKRFGDTIGRLLRAALFVSLIAVFLTAAGTYAYAEDEGEAEDNLLYITCTVDYDRAYEVLDMINSHRSSPLTMDSELQEAALIRAVENILYFEHARPNGGEWNSQNARVKGENLGKGSGSASRLMSLWMDSQGHRENILRSSFNSIGVSCVEYEGTYYWVQCFGTDGGDGGKRGETGAASVGIDLPGDDDYAIIHLSYNISRYMDGEYSESEEGEDPLLMDVGDSMDLGLIGDGWIEFDTTKINWKSSDENVASVDEDGTLHITAPGDAKITAASGSIDRASFDIVSKYNMKDVFILEDPIKPIVLSKYGPTLYGRDYTVARLSNEEDSTIKTVIRGVGDYRGIIEKTFETKTP